MLQKGTDDERPGIFWFAMPEEMEEMAAKQGFEKLKNLGTDFTITMKLVDGMSDEKFQAMKPLYDRMTSCESCTGMSNHALLVCRKK